MDLEKSCLIQDLFVIYGNLLTGHQQKIFESYHFDNLSLAEIGENFGISRQGVKDILDRCEKSLFSFEESLSIKEKNDKLILELEQKIPQKSLEKIKAIIYKRK